MVAQFFKGYASLVVTRPREVTTDLTFLTGFFFPSFQYCFKNIASIYQTFNISAIGFVDFLQCPPNIKEVEKRRGRLWRNSTIQLPGAGRIFYICYVNTPQKSNTLINLFSENGIWCSIL
jgi:hypothetical protein